MQYQVKSFIPKLVIVVGVIGFLYGFYNSTYYNVNSINTKKNIHDENEENEDNQKNEYNEQLNNNKKSVNFYDVNKIEVFETNSELDNKANENAE